MFYVMFYAKSLIIKECSIVRNVRKITLATLKILQTKTPFAQWKFEIELVKSNRIEQ